MNEVIKDLKSKQDVLQKNLALAQEKADQAQVVLADRQAEVAKLTAQLAKWNEAIEILETNTKLEPAPQ